MKAYTASVTAVTGLLLGGVVRATSAPFASRADATQWANTCHAVNREAGRDARYDGVSECEHDARYVIKDSEAYEMCEE